MDSESFYDDHVDRRLRDFLFGNRRIEAAWRSLSKGLEKTPGTILEIGCGIGFVAWQLQNRWAQAHVTALDLSGASIAVAQRLFGNSGVFYVQGRLGDMELEGPFDLIVMMDVYEHIEGGERQSFHRHVNDLLAPGGSIFVSVPTPHHQNYLRINNPSGLQPVDEDVSACDLERFAAGCQATIVSYQTISVWRKLDYAHCWIQRLPGAGFEPVQREGRLGRAGRRLRHAMPMATLERKRRATRVAKRLGPEWLKAAKNS